MTSERKTLSKDKLYNLNLEDLKALILAKEGAKTIFNPSIDLVSLKTRLLQSKPTVNWESVCGDESPPHQFDQAVQKIVLAGRMKLPKNNKMLTVDEALRRAGISQKKGDNSSPLSSAPTLPPAAPAADNPAEETDERAIVPSAATLVKENEAPHNGDSNGAVFRKQFAAWSFDALPDLIKHPILVCINYDRRRKQDSTSEVTPRERLMKFKIRGDLAVFMLDDSQGGRGQKDWRYVVATHIIEKMMPILSRTDAAYNVKNKEGKEKESFVLFHIPQQPQFAIPLTTFYTAGNGKLSFRPPTQFYLPVIFDPDEGRMELQLSWVSAHAPRLNITHKTQLDNFGISAMYGDYWSQINSENPIAKEEDLPEDQRWVSYGERTQNRVEKRGRDGEDDDYDADLPRPKRRAHTRAGPTEATKMRRKAYFTQKNSTIADWLEDKWGHDDVVLAIRSAGKKAGVTPDCVREWASKVCDVLRNTRRISGEDVEDSIRGKKPTNDNYASFFKKSPSWLQDAKKLGRLLDEHASSDNAAVCAWLEWDDAGAYGVSSYLEGLKAAINGLNTGPEHYLQLSK